MQHQPINHINSLPHKFTLPTTGRDRHLPPPGRAPGRVGARRLGRRPMVVDGGDGLPGAVGGAVSAVSDLYLCMYVYTCVCGCECGTNPFPIHSIHPPDPPFSLTKT